MFDIDIILPLTRAENMVNITNASGNHVLLHYFGNLCLKNKLKARS